MATRTQLAQTASIPIATTTTVDLRPRAARQAFDAAVLAHVRRAAVPVSVGDVMAAVGGGSQQIRSALARAIDLGHVAWSGVGRGTRYYVPGVGHEADPDA